MNDIFASYWNSRPSEQGEKIIKCDPLPPTEEEDLWTPEDLAKQQAGWEWKELSTTISREPDRKPYMFFPKIIREKVISCVKDGAQLCEDRKRQMHIQKYRIDPATGELLKPNPKFHNRRERRAYHRNLKQNMAADL